MRAAAFFLLLLPAPALAQGLLSADGISRAETGRPWLFAGTGYSDAGSLANRSVRASGGAGLGSAAGARFSFDAGLAHSRILKDGWLPDELYDASFRLNARGSANSLSAGLRSSSDRPFYSPHETDLSLNFARTVSRSGPHSFTAGVAYSSRRSFARHLPFPYLTYNYNSEKFTFRLPFSLAWRPDPAYELAASYMPPKYCQASAAWKASAALTLKAEFSLNAAQYELAGRPDKSYSVFIEQPSAGLRASYRTAGSYVLSLYAGSSLGGRYYQGKTYDDYRRGRTHIPGAPAVSLGVTRVFGLPFGPSK